jgi:hypothetical protein
LKVEPVEDKLRKYKIKMATTCSDNEQQQDAKSGAEL